MHKLLEGIGVANKQALTAPNKMLAYFASQPINCDAVAMLEKAMQPMESLITDVATSNELAAYVQTLDRQIDRLNNLEHTIAEYRKLYGAEYRKDEFDWQLENKESAIANLQALRTATAKNAITQPQILSINALLRLSDCNVGESIKQVIKEALQPIKTVIEAGTLTYLNKIIEKQYGTLTLVEVAHVCSKFVTGEIKIFGKLTISELSAAFIDYTRQKAEYLQLLADEAHLSIKDARSYGELSAAMQDSRDRLKQSEIMAKDIQDAKRFANREKLKQNYLIEPKADVTEYTFSPDTGEVYKTQNGITTIDD